VKKKEVEYCLRCNVVDELVPKKKNPAEAGRFSYGGDVEN